MSDHLVTKEMLQKAEYYQTPVLGICRVTRSMAGMTICREGDHINILGTLGDSGIIAELPCGIKIYLLQGEYETTNPVEETLSGVMMIRKVNNFYDYLLAHFDGMLDGNVDFDVTRAIDHRTLHVTIDEFTRAIVITPVKKDEET